VGRASLHPPIFFECRNNSSALIFGKKLLVQDGGNIHTIFFSVLVQRISGINGLTETIIFIAPQLKFFELTEYHFKTQSPLKKSVDSVNPLYFF